MDTSQHQSFDSLQLEMQRVSLRKKMQNESVLPNYSQAVKSTIEKILENADNS